MGKKAMKKMIMRKVLSCFVVFVILMSAVPVSGFAVNDTAKSTDKLNIASLIPSSSSNTVSGTFELLRNGYNDIGPKHKYLDCGGNVNYFDISVLFNWEDSGVERLKIDASTGESFESGLYPTACGEDVFILDSTCGKITLNYDGLKSDSDGWHYKYSYTIEESDSKPSLAISVWTDKSEYNIGETVTMYYKTNKKCTAKLTITKPDGGKVVYGPNEIPACTRSKSPTAGYPTGKRTVVFEAWAGSEYKKATCYFDVVEEKKPKQPSPKIFKVTYPTTCVNEGEYATISVTVKNNGGPSSEGYISVSFPNDEYIPRSRVSGTGNGYNELYQKGFWPIWNSKGEQMKSVDPLVELQEKNWRNDQQETITMSVKPNSGSDKIVFYVRAALKNDADGSYERDPTYSGNKDQQGWYVKKYSVDVCEYEEVKFRGKILADYPIISFYSFDVKIDEVLDDPTGNLQEGETVNVYGHRSGPAQVDDVTVGDEVEVLGEYRGYVGTYEQIFLSDWDESSSDHYLKLCGLVVTDISFSRLPHEKEPVTITATVTNNGDYGKSNVYVNFKNGFDTIGYTMIDYIPAHSTATASIQWEKPIKSFDPSFPSYYTNNIGATVDESAYFTEVTIGDTGGIGYSVTHINPSELPVTVPYQQFGELILFDSKAKYLGTKEIRVLSAVLDAAGEGIEYGSMVACAAAITISAHTFGSTAPALSVCFGVPIGAFVKIAANLLSDMADGWPEQFDFSSNMEPSSDGNIQIMLVVSLDAVSGDGETTSDKYNLDYYYKDTMDNWIHYYNTKEYITIQSPNQISATMECPANLHAYDSQGRHVGVNAQGGMDLEIPAAYYTGPDSVPEGIVILNHSGAITFKVEALDTGEFDFTLTQNTDTKTTTVTYLDVPITGSTEATVDVSQANPTYTMKIDDNGDGVADREKKPTNVTVSGCKYDHDGDGIVEDDIDDLIMATDAYLGFNTGTEYDADGDGIVEDDIDDLIMATDAYLGFITCEGED